MAGGAKWRFCRALAVGQFAGGTARGRGPTTRVGSPSAALASLPIMRARWRPGRRRSERGLYRSTSTASSWGSSGELAGVARPGGTPGRSPEPPAAHFLSNAQSGRLRHHGRDSEQSAETLSFAQLVRMRPRQMNPAGLHLCDSRHLRLHPACAEAIESRRAARRVSGRPIRESRPVPPRRP